MNLTEPMNISAYQLLDLEVAHEMGVVWRYPGGGRYPGEEVSVG